MTPLLHLTREVWRAEPSKETYFVLYFASFAGKIQNKEKIAGPAACDPPLF
jgi:hypothetical protein